MSADVTSPPLDDSITVAFDPDFDSNRTVYAASRDADNRIYRFIIGTSDYWESIDGTLPDGAVLNQLKVLPDGILYAVNSKADDGMERCLNPNYSLGPTFETVTRGLSDGATLCGLWQSGNRLWSIDTTNIRLLTFRDSLTAPVTATSPADSTSGTGNIIDHTIRNVSLDQDTMEGATSYQWQLEYDTDFSSVPDGFEGSPEASSARLPTLKPATTYYWRVRASAPVLSPWSTKMSFTTSLDTEVVALRLESPKAGASEVPIKPVFQWTAINGADSYELMVSADANFTNPSIIKKDDYTIPATAWQCNLSLDYDTTYYWKVRAISASTFSAFTTESSSADTSTEPPEKLTLLLAQHLEKPPQPATVLTPVPAHTAPVQPVPPPPPAPPRHQSSPKLQARRTG